MGGGCVGVGDGRGVGSGVGDGRGVMTTGEGVGDGRTVAVGDGEGVGVGDGTAFRDALGVGVASGVLPDWQPDSSSNVNNTNTKTDFLMHYLERKHTESEFGLQAG